MLGASELPLRRGFASGKTLVRRKCAAARQGRFPPCCLAFTSLFQSKRSSERMTFCFGFRRPEAALTILYKNPEREHVRDFY